MGKLVYAESLYGRFSSLCDLSREDPEAMTGAAVVLNLQEGVRSLMRQDIDVRTFFEARMEHLRQSVLIGDEIGSGIVPMEPFERRWRDETGLLYQILAREATIVDRVWAGLPTRLKG